jgi:hypothetical protein
VPKVLRLETWYTVTAARLDTAEMQKGTRAPGRVYPSWRVPAGSPNVPTGERWGRVILEGGTSAFPMAKTSRLLRRVMVRLATEVSDHHPVDGTFWDPFTVLESMQEEEWHSSPQWNEQDILWWVSSLYGLEAADVKV